VPSYHATPKPKDDGCGGQLRIGVVSYFPFPFLSLPGGVLNPTLFPMRIHANPPVQLCRLWKWGHSDKSEYFFHHRVRCVKTTKQHVLVVIALFPPIRHTYLVSCLVIFLSYPRSIRLYSRTCFVQVGNPPPPHNSRNVSFFLIFFYRPPLAPCGAGAAPSSCHFPPCLHMPTEFPSVAHRNPPPHPPIPISAE